jgi:hypothetical protein
VVNLKRKNVVRSNQRGRKRMKKLIFILFFFIFASSASATVFKWVDEGGVVNFTDDYNNVPPVYRERAEEVNAPKMQTSASSQPPFEKTAVNVRSGGTATQAPGVAQTLIREGDFAMKLAESLKVGQVKSEAEAESVLALAGIVPRNGWIADYPVTPDIIGELQNSIDVAVDSGSLAMNKDEAMKAFQDLTAQQGLPVKADVERQESGSEPSQDYSEYQSPEVINNYYYNQGPPIVTYYPPPWDYYYLYAWIPYPFWCSGVRFRGFFVLNDFHKFVSVKGRVVAISNHVMDPKTRRVISIDPKTRGIGKVPHTLANGSHTRGLTSPEAKRGAVSIFERSQERTKGGNSVPSTTGGGPRRQIPSHGNSSPSTLGSRVATVRPPTTTPWAGRSETGMSPRSLGSSPGRATVPRSYMSPGGNSPGGSHGNGSFGSGGSSGGG